MYAEMDTMCINW